MSKAFELISESLTEIIEDLEKNDGKNLSRETLSIKFEDNKKAPKTKTFKTEKFFEPAVSL